MNHSWEQARFEVCFQKWLDLAEYGYGVSFMSDCKYGVSIYDSQVELTLLKCGRYPNPSADRCHHEFIYSIYPHEGDWQQAGTVKEAYAVNNPVTVRVKGENASMKCGADGAGAGKLSAEFEAVHISKNNVIAEVLKRSEDGKSEIVRLYECWNQRTNAEFTFAKAFAKVSLCNMLEEEEKVLAEHENSLKVGLKPYEIITLKVEY